VVIVVDADRLNVNAQNAFLKTLEEPAQGTHLILTTSRLRAILPTVVSRCQRVPFRPIPLARIAAAVAERRQLPLAQATVAAALGGSLERALELELEPLLELRDRMAELDRRLFGRTPRRAIEALELAAELGEERADAVARAELLALWLHDQLVLASGAREAELANADRRADLEALAAERGLPRIIARLRAVMEARRQLESTFNFKPQMIAEQLCLALAGHHPVVVAERA
jgi:DNA polymerase-3 subunit delta'